MQTWNNPQSSGWDKAGAVVSTILRNANNAMLAASLLDPATALGIGGEEAAGEEAGSLIGDVVEGCGGGLSFTAETKVSTNQGKQGIGSLKPGEQVWAYNPQTQKMELQPIMHVWINHDDDLIDLTLTIPEHEEQGKLVAQTSEVVHTNKKHPFLTQEEGFVPVGELVPGMHIVRADGSVGVVSQWVVIHGVKTMYNLEIAQDHTFTIGYGKWVVHNDCGPQMDPTKIRFTQSTIRGTFDNGQSINDTASQLRSGALSPSNIPAIRVFQMTEEIAESWADAQFSNGRYVGDPANLDVGEIYTLDNRRLAAFKIAGVASIPVNEASMEEILNEMWKFTTPNRGWEITVLR